MFCLILILKTLESLVSIDSASAFCGAPPLFGYSTRPVHIQSMILPPPVSVVFAGTSGFSGWMPSMTIAPSLLAPASPPLLSPLEQPAATSANAAPSAMAPLARFETLIPRGLLFLTWFRRGFHARLGVTPPADPEPQVAGTAGKSGHPRCTDPPGPPTNGRDTTQAAQPRSAEIGEIVVVGRTECHTPG